MTISSVELLKKLSEADGVSGFEKEAKEAALSYLKKSGDISGDRLGSVICKKKGTLAGPSVMLTAHIDEIGFIVKHITKEGFIKFLPLGGWSTQVLPAKRVKVKTAKGDILGVIGSKPPHLLTPEEAKKPLTLDSLFIDIGASSEVEAEKFGVKAGDPVVPVAEFSQLKNKKLLLGKAFDDRVGCAVMIKVMDNLKNEKTANSLFGVAAVQEEVGHRGGITSTFIINPDVAIVLECRIANDFPGTEKHELYSCLGKGALVTFHDPGMIPNLKLRNLVVETAREEKIPYQAYTVNTGFTDGAVVHKSRSGIPTIVIGVPTRYFHSHAAIINLDDFESAVELVTAVIKKLDEKTARGFTE
ncbi:MAG: peptidase M28 [Candidatus Firestonebacteria bacterium RIFOXYA2_FULL_40_8]|nr:MAG: peptidase M28 [Candidatus Firestonebacteria bacterium RIFOXYA2_FULL_40_8]